MLASSSTATAAQEQLCAAVAAATEASHTVLNRAQAPEAAANPEPHFLLSERDGGSQLPSLPATYEARPSLISSVHHYIYHTQYA